MTHTHTQLMCTIKKKKKKRKTSQDLLMLNSIEQAPALTQSVSLCTFGHFECSLLHKCPSLRLHRAHTHMNTHAHATHHHMKLTGSVKSSLSASSPAGKQMGGVFPPRVWRQSERQSAAEKLRTPQEDNYTYSWLSVLLRPLFSLNSCTTSDEDSMGIFSNSGSLLHLGCLLCRRVTTAEEWVTLSSCGFIVWIYCRHSKTPGEAVKGRDTVSEPSQTTCWL